MSLARILRAPAAMPSHPFVWVRESSRTRTFCVFAGLAVVTLIGLQVLGGPLKTSASPAGIVSFELAGSLANVERILTAWDPMTRVFAGLDLGIDYLFIVTYVGAIGLGCVLAGERLARHARPLAAAGPWLAWAMLLAGVLDCVENYSLIRLLVGAQDDALAVLARSCAIAKFAIVVPGLLYMIVGLVMSAAPRTSRDSLA
jgi:hypothetical protein